MKHKIIFVGNLDIIFLTFVLHQSFCRSSCEAGSDTWVQCNDSPVKVCKYPAHGLSVGHSYHFRVRAVNSAGISRASRKSDKVTTLDPAESERLQGTEEGKHKMNRESANRGFLMVVLLLFSYNSD